MNMKYRLLTVGIVLAAFSFTMPSQLFALELNRSFSNGMVLQREKPLRVWGTSKAGDTITVKFAGQTAKATADKDGRWVATLKAIPANPKGQKLTVHSPLATRPLTLDNVVVGDVFLFARQTSIDVSLGTTPAGKKAAAAGTGNKTFRFITIKTSPSRTPLDNLKKDATTGWTVVDKKSALTMSAAAFYLGRDLTKDVKVPVGIVDLDMGYHFASAWLSKKGIERAVDGESDAITQLKWAANNQQKHFDTWDKESAGLELVVKKDPKDPRNKAKRKFVWEKAATPKRMLGFRPIELPYSPAVCYRAVIHPLRGLTLKGIVLQLGTDYPYVAFTRLRNMGKNMDRERLGTANGQTYWINKTGNRMTPVTLPVIIDDLRASLGDESLPLAWLMPGGSDVYEYAVHNREVREVQRRAQAKAKGVDLILPGDEHVPMSGQPADEALLASRCKQWALTTFYGKKGAASGPVFDRAEFGDDAVTIFFKGGTAEGLTAKDDALKHFEIAGGDREFETCRAQIKGTTITLTSDTVSQPKYVRFGWNTKPPQGLVNIAGLPAMPFNTNPEWEYNWWPDPTPVELPEEYFTPANKWPDRDYAIVNYATEKGGKHLGPTGLWGTPAGPNLYVTRITPGSPADGKVLVGDMIFGVNGTEFTPGEDDKYIQFAGAISKAEAVKGGGKMVLNIRRDGKLIEVPVKMEYMGAFSATTPWDCEKSGNIVKKAEEYMYNGLRPKVGVPNDSDYMYGPWNDTVLFLLASGNPKMQGLVRRYIRQRMDELDRSKRGEKVGAFNGYGGWGSSYMMLLLGEYYHRTGDSAVLPHLEFLVARQQRGFVERQKAGNWPPVGPSGYGTHPATELPKVMGLVLAREAGVKVNQPGLYYALKHLHDRRAENGFILYNGYGAFTIESRQIPKPLPMDPKKKAEGHIVSMNGKLGTGAALFSMLDGYEKAVKNCSERCVYAFSHTRKGHGGAWFNNFWTPIGAYHAGKEKYQHFMKGHQWWRELYRDHTGAIWQSHNAKEVKKSTLATSYAIHRVAHYKRLRMFGAPRTVFATKPPAYLKDALAAHQKRDYAAAEKLIQKVVNEQEIPAKDQAMVRHFLETVQTLKKSIEHDLTYTEGAIKRGEYALAGLELPQLEMVVNPDNPRLKAIAAAVGSQEAQAKIAAALKRAKAAQMRARKAKGAAKEAGKATVAAELASIDTIVKDGHIYNAGRRAKYPSFPKEQLNRWRIQVLETPAHTPKGWEQVEFDDSRWNESTLPIIWPMAHTAMLRTSFEVKDVTAYEALHVRAHVYKQRNLEVYLNGKLVAKVNNMPHTIDFPLTPYAMKILKNGRNTLAVMSQHGKRVVNFSFRLEGRLKE